MNTANFNPNRFVLDPAANSALRANARHNQAAALKDVARQFEGLMFQMILKSMREATPSNGLLDSDQTRFFMSILDQQLAQNLAAESPIGFSKMIERQLGKTADGADLSGALAPLQAPAAWNRAPDFWMNPAVRAFERTPRASGTPEARNIPDEQMAAMDGNGGQSFVMRIWPYAQEAAKTLGVPPHFVVAHSALESGWGKHEIRLPDGSPSYNLFGIKAGKSWNGRSAEVLTTEYENGAPVSVRAKFRVYSSYAEAFRDYAGLLRGKARFAQVIGQRDGAGFARSLQESGYATDPLYADKLGRIIGGATLRQAISG
jgi:flagellar protein FlgJ